MTALRLAYRARLVEVGRHALAPDAQRDVRHGEVFSQVEVERMRERRKIGRAHQRGGQAMDLFADSVVFLAELDQLAELALQQARLVAQRDRLALSERNRP